MKELLELYPQLHESSIERRLFSLGILKQIKERYNINILSTGLSTQGCVIEAWRFGKGTKKVGIWSQMHGNESTGTAAMMDLIHFLHSEHPLALQILNRLDILYIPVLNPDGALEATRVNAMGIDLNRDALARQAPESQFLRKTIDDFKPEVLFNLHDQRSIFNVGCTPKPATISFLAPSEGYDRAITSNRKKTMGIISAMNQALQTFISGQIGRYNDAFYPTATGDNFQKAGYPTVLIEAGTYNYEDREKQKTRKYNWLALVSGFLFIAQNDDYTLNHKSYFDIPENGTQFYDLIFRNIKLKHPTQNIFVDIAVMIKDTLSSDKKSLIPSYLIENIGDLSFYYAHKEVNCNGKLFNHPNSIWPKLGQDADFLFSLKQ